MSIEFPGAGDIASTVARLRTLADDLERMTVFRPSSELEGAPRLHSWRPILRPRPALTGWVEGHPALGSKEVVTSEIFAIDPQAGWARAFSRFYALGAPADDIKEFN